jgi:UDP-glucose:tetrahydrobiopterin glucosyltransferase
LARVKPLKVLFVSTSVGNLGSGAGGGVELTILNTAQELISRGNQLLVVAPKGSYFKAIPILEIPGVLQSAAQHQERSAAIEMPGNSVLANMWDYARLHQHEYDLIVNFAYDWLPFYLTPFFKTPVAHLVSMGSCTDALDDCIAQVVQRYPHSIAVYTKIQADTFAFGQDCVPIGSGLDLSLYQFRERAESALCWLGRISPEKGLEDAVAAATATGMPLRVLGHLQDEAYFDRVLAEYPQAQVEYLGFKQTQEMQEIVGQCRSLLVTSRWVEAFGNVVIEALACGVPVIAYRRGGPAEIVRHGETGWLVEPDSVAGLIEGIQNLDQIDRHRCRQQAEEEFSLKALGDRTEAWFAAVHNSWPK